MAKGLTKFGLAKRRPMETGILDIEDFLFPSSGV
jgi:hypothetical protein